MHGTMKKQLLLLAALVIGGWASAQNAVEFQPYVGFQFGNTVHGYDGVVKTQMGSIGEVR